MANLIINDVTKQIDNLSISNSKSLKYNENIKSEECTEFKAKEYLSYQINNNNNNSNKENISNEEVDSSSAYGGDNDSSNNIEESDLLKNENYHLQLELNERNDEISMLKSSILKLQRQLFQRYSPLNLTINENNCLIEYSPKKTFSHAESDEIITHFSSSSYGGSPKKDIETFSTYSEKSNKFNNNLDICKENLLTFFTRIIEIFEYSQIFKEDTHNLRSKLERCFEEKVVMVQLLDDIIMLQRQCVVCLNRELEYKKITQQLDYLATIFVDPLEYGLKNQEHIRKLRHDVMNIIANIYKNRSESPIYTLNDEMVKKVKKRSTLKQKKLRLAQCEKMLNISTICDKNDHKFEFTPIGLEYYENKSFTPKKHFSLTNNLKQIKMTPLRNMNDSDCGSLHDPLQKFYEEILTGTDQDDTKTTTSSINNF